VAVNGWEENNDSREWLQACGSGGGRQWLGEQRELVGEWCAEFTI